MTNNAKFLSLDTTLAWLGQFDVADQWAAIDLLQSIQLVSRDNFNDSLRELIIARSKNFNGPIGLYAERELNHRRGIPHRLFKEYNRKIKHRKIKRAYGVGPQPVRPVRAYDLDVGSEGIVAQLISELCREFPKTFISHPGPDSIRKRQIRRFMLVTDFIGSGRRAYQYLEAAWRVRSVRSWWSAKNSVGMRFEVVAYSATDHGCQHVQSHRSSPAVHIVKPCDSLKDYSTHKQLNKLKELCIRYDPVDRDKVQSLGFNGTGALIAFAHGVPNNSPRILHATSRNWIPLFPKRITSGTRNTFSGASEVSEEIIKKKLLEIRQAKLAAAPWIKNAKPHVRKSLMILAALSRPPRDLETISRRSGLTILEVEKTISKALAFGWIDDASRLTDQGHAELDNARYKPETIPLPEPPEMPYYPQSLRAPSKVSS